MHKTTTSNPPMRDVIVLPRLMPKKSTSELKKTKLPTPCSTVSEIFFVFFQFF
uniref:Uncharacterized protein n=1 Tax=viral metagenome TaxID=1070528 RepID=A0A6C0HIM3_9ZZZZ